MASSLHQLSSWVLHQSIVIAGERRRGRERKGEGGKGRGREGEGGRGREREGEGGGGGGGRGREREGGRERREREGGRGREREGEGYKCLLHDKQTSRHLPIYKATQHNSTAHEEDFFREKSAASGGTRTHDTLLSTGGQLSSLPTELLK